MNTFSFKNLDFFKKSNSLSKESKDSSPQGHKKNKLKFWVRIIQEPFVFVFIFVVVLSYFLSYVPSRSLPALQEGEIAPKDIIAPSDLIIEDKETTEKRTKEAEESVLPVYIIDQNVFLTTEEKIREFFSSGRELLKNNVTTKKIEEFKQAASEKYGIEPTTNTIKSLVKLKFNARLEEILINLIGKISEQGIIVSKNLFIHGEQDSGFTVIKGDGSEKFSRIPEILDIKESKEKLSEEINKLELSQNEKSLLAQLSHGFISPNITYNKMETDARKEKACSRVETVFYTIKKGKVIVRKGDEVDQEAIKQINLINKNLEAKPNWIINFIGTFLLFGLLFITLWFYIKSILDSQNALKNFVMIGITLVLSLIFYKLSIFLADTFSMSTDFFLLRHSESYRYAFPYQFSVLLLAFLTQTHIALIVTVVNSIFVGYLFKANLYLVIFSLLGGFAAIYGIKYYGKQKRTSIFSAGILVIAPINAFVILTFHLISEKMSFLDVFASELLMGILGGILSATLAFLFLPIYESVFGIVTQSKLLEITNSDLPIFRKMAMEAPGTYHHSLIVSTLSEKAAEEIKLDSMLIKAGSLYHDIGKIKRPEYFMENRTRNFDMHKDLKPSMSTLVIVSHVKEGLELAKKLRLPKKIREIIEQHHGNSLVKYFFEKAKEKYDPEMHKIGEESYRYPGPRPKSKEAALIMLADSVEAASRSLKSTTKANLKRVITDIFNNYIQDGQMDDSDFSLKELKSIANSFFTTLYTIYHHRLEYPGFDFESKMKLKPEKTIKSNDRNHKSTK